MRCIVCHQPVNPCPKPDNPDLEVTRCPHCQATVIEDTPEEAYSIYLSVTRNRTGETYENRVDIPIANDFYRDDLPAIQHALITAVADFYENGETAIPARPGSSYDDGARPTPTKEEFDTHTVAAAVEENERIRNLIKEERTKIVPVAPLAVPEQNVKLALQYLTALLADQRTEFNFERMKTRLSEILTPVPTIPNTRPLPTYGEVTKHAKKIKKETEEDKETSPFKSPAV